jgi:predicted CoA-binding protein
MGVVSPSRYYQEVVVEERERIDAFLAEKELAVAGVSRGGNKFGNTIYRELRQRGYTVHPINPHAAEVEGTRCYASVAELPQGTGGVIAVVPPGTNPRAAEPARRGGNREGLDAARFAVPGGPRCV